MSRFVLDRVPHRSRPEELLLELSELGGHLSADLSPLEAGACVLRRGMAAIGAACGTAHVVVSLGASVDVVELGSRSSVPAVAAEALELGEEAWLSTRRDIDARFPGAAAQGSGALASVRIDVGGMRAGGLVLWFEEERDFPESERAFLGALGRILAQEVDRASLRRRQREADRDREKMAHWADALSDAFRLIATPASLKRSLDELARASCETPADFSAISVLSADGQSLEFRGLHTRDPAQGELLHRALQGCSKPATLGDIARVLESGTSLLVPTVDMPRLVRTYAGTPFGEYVARFPISTLIIVPLRSKGSVFGVVTVARTAREPFQEADMRFLEEVADRAAVAIENANLLEKLAHSEEQLRVALEAGRLGAWDWDIPAQRVTWSTMLEKIHGLDTGGFAGTFEAYQHDMHPEDRERVLSTIARAVEQRTDYDVVYRIIRRDGEVRWLEAHGRVLCDPAGKPQRMVGVCMDVTERRKSEEQLHEMLLALRDADQRKDHFLAMLAHELRNPLGPMLNATYLLGNCEIGDEAASCAREILDRQVGHMARLLDDLLDVSRITRGKIELMRETVDMSALVREVVGDHLESFRAAGLALDLTVAAAPLFVHADRTRLAQVVGNLLSNALKFSEPGQSVRVRVDREESGQSMVLTVRDEGTGIEPAVLDQMFDPFVQADTSLARPRGGLGLGLAVVKGLVVVHGGRVSASSGGSGTGAELRVELPLHTARHEIAESSDPAPGVAHGSAATVLIFEDNADAAESLRVILSGAGYRVWIEPTGRKAMQVVTRVRPAVVLCDLGLPDRDGYGIATDIRADPESSHLPLIAISGYGTVDDRARSKRAGFDLHFTKPVPPALLLSELSRRLARAGAPSQHDDRNEPFVVDKSRVHSARRP